LDCTKLLEETVASLKEYGVGAGGSGGGLDDEVMEEEKGNEQVRRNRRHHRRLLVDAAQQHGDDGGFGNEGIGAGAEAQAEAEEGGDDAIPEEKWGKEAAAESGGGAGLTGGRFGGKDLREGDDARQLDDLNPGGIGSFVELTAKHLFCLAASENPPDEVKQEIQCDASKSKRRTLLELWSAARAQMQDQLLLKVLDLAREVSHVNLLGQSYNLWAPSKDDGLSFMVASLNSDKDVDNGGLHGLDGSLGAGKVFVDVGSCLGLTCLAINTKYPGTKIVSLEPASPNWLLQEMNLRCNLDHKTFKKIHVVLAGVGPNTDDEDNMMAKLMWRPTATTSTRAWSPSTEHRENDVELVVRLRRLKSVLAEADVYDGKIDVLNIDCEGCEYNLIPALSEAEFEAIPTVMGAVHWGYIPFSKLPSSARAKTTHERLCGHENIARETKECCAFPDLPVKSSVPGEVLVRDQGSNNNPLLNQPSTVSDVTVDGLCDGFSTWAAEHYLYDIQEDWGWFELSSQA
jgi:FkbM family methyltransferase